LYLRLSLKRIRESPHVVLERTLVAEELDISTIDLDAALLAAGDVVFAAEGSEAPVLGDDDLLAAGELVLRAAESFDGGGAVRIPCPHGQDDLTDVDTSDSAVGLAKGTTHTSLESIGSGTRQHLIDTDNMVRVSADTKMESFLSGNLDEVLVGADTGGFESLGAQLLIFVRDEVDAEREFVDVGAFTAEIEDTDLRVGHTTVEARLGVRLVLAVAVATSWTTGPLNGTVSGWFMCRSVSCSGSPMRAGCSRAGRCPCSGLCFPNISQNAIPC